MKRIKKPKLNRYYAHWSDNLSQLGQATVADKGEKLKAPFCYLSAANLEQANRLIDAFNQTWKKDRLDTGMNPAHMPTERLRDYGFTITF